MKRKGVDKIQSRRRRFNENTESAAPDDDQDGRKH